MVRNHLFAGYKMVSMLSLSKTLALHKRPIIKT